MGTLADGRRGSFEVGTDVEKRIVLQRIDGPLDESGFSALTEEMDRHVARLVDPADIRILLDGRNLAKIDGRTRSLALRTFHERNVRRMAVWGCSPLIRVLIRFMALAEGRGRIRAFPTEPEARAWLAT